MTFGYLRTLYVRMCGINNLEAHIRCVLGFAFEVGYDQRDIRAVSTIETLA
jgi:hypothetical protein